MKVKLISYFGGDWQIAKTAWASTRKDGSEEDRDRVVTMNINEVHKTPLETSWLVFLIECPIFVERQLDKYRMSQQLMFAPFGRFGITQNELSMRYKKYDGDFYHFPEHLKSILKDDFVIFEQAYNEELQNQIDFYRKALTKIKHLPREEMTRVRDVLRGVLGTSFFTTMQIQINLSSFQHLINERIKDKAQIECQMIAQMMVEEVKTVPEFKVCIEKMIEVNQWNLSTLI